jgi:tRNA pseudouridine38-40 synthase
VANFKTESAHSPEIFRRGLNALLPDDIAILSAEEVDLEWHARFSAVEREYRYTVLNRSSRSAINRRFAYWVSALLNLKKMQQAGSVLIGEHDFASFAGAGMGVQPDDEELGKRGTVRQVRRLDIIETGDNIIELWIAADAFLPHMVRNIVGTLIQVGSGKISLEEFTQIFAACDRRLAGPTAPAGGLCLVSVKY